MVMRQILALITIFLLIFLVGCGKEKDESKITAEVVKESESKKTGVTEKVKEEITTTVKICYDSDNGIIKWEKGTVMGFYNDTRRFEFDDHCYNKNYVVEYYCENEEPLKTIFLCRNGCIDSHCA